MKEHLYGMVPTALRIQGISYFRNLALDLLDVLRQQQDTGAPPRRLNYSGAGDFRQVGENNLMLCRSAGGLQRHDRVLDIGCGVGRTAMAMATYLEEPGSYTGFDAMKSAVQWCQKHIHSPAARFDFIHADLFNKMYNPHGRIRSELYSFPVKNGSISFALATSLFTHMEPKASTRYIAECRRALGRDGTLLSTWFLLDSNTEYGVSEGRALMTFPHRLASHAQQSQTVAEKAIAYRTDFVLSLLDSQGFHIEAIGYGRWSGIAASIDSFQDVLVARKV